MRLPITPQTTLMRELRAEMRGLYPAGRIVIAVDGIGTASVDAFAELFMQIIGEDGSAVFHARLADFQLPRASQVETGLVTDEEAIRRALVGPFRAAPYDSATSGFQLATWDARRDAPVESRWVTAPDDAVLVVSGTGLLSPALRGLVNWSVWLQADEARLAERPGRSPENPYTPTEFAYLKTAQPAGAATVLVDNADPEAPVQIYRDFC